MTGLILLALASATAADVPDHGFVNRVYKDAAGHEAKYVVFVPYGYDGTRQVPAILFLHGLGESGTDGQKQVKVGLGPSIKKQAKTFGFLTVFPQSQKRTWQAKSEDAQRALAMLDQVEKEYNVDRSRVYLTGLSMGGYGTWSLAAAYPDRWAAIVPICGGGNTAKAQQIEAIPCWCFHGEADKTVPAALSRQMIESLKAAGGHPKYVEYPGVGHNSWDRAYATPDLFTWLLNQHRP
jgi:predicted peptidase